MIDRNIPLSEPCPNCSCVHTVQLTISGTSVVSGVVSRRPEWFSEKLKDMRSNVGKTNTLDKGIN